jgi:hypothetical protein
MVVKCKKSLYKSTYKGWAFNRGKEYKVISHDKRFFYVKDNEGHEFSLAKENISPYYWFETYFKR